MASHWLVILLALLAIFALIVAFILLSEASKARNLANQKRWGWILLILSILLFIVLAAVGPNLNRQHQIQEAAAALDLAR